MTLPARSPDERAYAGAEHLEPAYGAAYDTKARLGLEDALESPRRHGLGPEATVAGLGCGTGLLAAAAGTATCVRVRPRP